MYFFGLWGLLIIYLIWKGLLKYVYSQGFFIKMILAFLLGTRAVKFDQMDFVPGGNQQSIRY